MIHIAIQPPLPARMPRVELMERLTVLYAQGVTVDNSVGGATFDFSSYPRKAT